MNFVTSESSFVDLDIVYVKIGRVPFEIVGNWSKTKMAAIPGAREYNGESFYFPSTHMFFFFFSVGILSFIYFKQFTLSFILLTFL